MSEQMKRRRIPFDSQFYVVFFNALARSPHVEYPLLRNRWTDWNKLRRTLPEDRRHLQVFNAFIRALVRHKHFDAAVEAFEGMPAEGHLAPDSFTVLEILPALRHAGKNVHYQRVRDIWQARKDADVVDPKASLKFAAAFLQSPDPTDVELAKSILVEHLGVRLDQDPPLAGGKASLDAGSFSSLLKMLADLGRQDVAAKMFRQVVGNSQAYLEPNAMDLGHCATGILFLAEQGQVDKVMGAQLRLLRLPFQLTAGRPADVLQWMVKIRRPKLAPVSDTLEKSLQAAFRAKSPSAAFLILLSLARRFDLLAADEADHPVVVACRSRNDLAPVRLTSRGACTLLHTVRDESLDTAARAMTLLDTLDGRLPLSVGELRELVEAERRASPSPLRPFSAPQERQWRDRLVFAQHAVLSRLAGSRYPGPWSEWRDDLAEEMELATGRREKDQAVARIARG